MANKNGAKKPVARRNRKNIDKGEAHIHSSFNNTIVTITDTNGNYHRIDHELALSGLY